MPRRRLLTGVVLALGSLAGTIAIRRRFAKQQERVDVYFEDGSMLSLSDGSPGAARLLPLARQIISQSRPA